ncbi:helix-turn-helix domain-containing protein [Spirosoma sp. KUDC1026]|uniref:helix-turn-helix domain-containing protein n=1 Tax=Spirosoma sp. KUDC1026 TaxID=2745947 RepID=UPI00159BE519|nr:helix-turn-helix domain-containing protein [Spirosoma sp. KUDC1026]
MEKAKELLASSSLSVSEITFYPGFKHAPSFNRFFKQKTSETPLAFRQSFN